MNQKSSPKVLVIVLLLVLVGGLVYYFTKQNKATLPTAVTSNWKTCTNSKLGFTIKYPTNFVFDPTTCNYAINDFSLVKDINVVTATDDLQQNWLLTITSEKSTLNVIDWIKSKDLCQSDLCPRGIVAGPIVDSQAFDKTSHYAETDVVTKVNGTIFRFALSARNPNTPPSSDIKDIFGQVLSTFKLTN